MFKLKKSVNQNYVIRNRKVWNVLILIIFLINYFYCLPSSLVHGSPIWSQYTVFLAIFTKKRYRTAAERYRTAINRYRTAAERYRTAAERYRTAVKRYFFPLFSIGITAVR